MNQPVQGGAVVELSEVSMYYGSRKVTDAINLELRRGEVLSIVGPSGCGKTTLLRAVAGLNRPGSGEIRVDGVPVAGAAPEGVSMVFQHFGLFPWKTVEANIAYPLVVRGVRKKDAVEQTRRLVEMVGLSGFENSYPHQLSGGMQQRTGLARALAVNPRVLLMDEPFGALDAQTREVLQFELLDLWATSAVTTLFVTHSIEEAVLFGDRIAVLRGQPSSVVELIDVNLPKPRERSVMATPEFARLREHVWNLVMSNEVPA
ncbi:ABC transporter ATP-binding protein [Glaciibacter superstes]|uniref:ABC transporter ATP-binding protein n=1 Tax=Glaciibacter superstes TaxID=501023 RepID=UPI0012F9A940|nr:ABC transporter ATP-binding protein [Glaciibacter superstes]